MGAAKDIVIFLDGTSNSSQGYVTRWRTEPSYTNVYKLFVVLTGPQYTTAYFPGVGTYALIDKVPMVVIGRGVWPRLLQAYQFIVANHMPGDRISVFGFSRGAFTARHLAGLITRVGLDRSNLIKTHLIIREYVHNLLHQPPEQGDKASVQFLGMWDSVASTRLTYRRHPAQFNGRLEKGIRYVAHALARHERRRCFRPQVYQDSKDSYPKLIQCVLDGAHSDVGGAAPRSFLSDCALQWMAERARAAELLVPDLASALTSIGVSFQPKPDTPSHPWLGLGVYPRHDFFKKHHLA